MSSIGASASTTTHRFTHFHTDLPTRIGHGTSPCRYYLRPIAASDLGQFQQSHWGDLVEPLDWSTAPNVTDPQSPRLACTYSQRPHMEIPNVTCKCNENCSLCKNAPKNSQKSPNILGLSANGKKVANFWQIPASEGGTLRVLSGLWAGILVT